MKPSSKQIVDLRRRILAARSDKGLSCADLAKITDVHPSQVSRICAGDFKTFSNNVVQICHALNVKVPRIQEGGMDPIWAQANASLNRIWDRTPEGAVNIKRVLDAIADLRLPESSSEKRR